MRREKRVRNVILDTVRAQKGLSLGIVFVVIGAVVAALIPPLILARMVDTVTEGKQAALVLILLYFGMLALAGLRLSVMSFEGRAAYRIRAEDDACPAQQPDG